MLAGWFVFLVAVAYLSILFAIAFYGDRRADEGRSLINNPYIYALSIAVYCTSWTFYGSVGRAASNGFDFLPIYLGPTLVFVLWAFFLSKIVRISKANRITSIADFIASRYGKSMLLGGVVTVIAVIGILPYIALQLKAVSTSYTILLQYPDIVMPRAIGKVSAFRDTAFFVAIMMAMFAILFGTRHIDAAEHHEGMVLAIAFESVVKLIAFLAVGLFVTYGAYGGFAELFAKAAERPEVSRLYTQVEEGSYVKWATLMILSMAAIVCLPRQFQVTVVENVDESHLKKASWLFPCYLLAINIFVLPIAIGGLLQFPGGAVDGDTFVLTVPMAQRQESLALLAFIGGLSAATGMIIVATIALSTMVCNDLVMPVLFRLRWLRIAERGDLTGLLLAIRRISIFLVLLLAYGYFYFIGESYALVTIGLISFTAAAQFAPAIVGGIFWRAGTRSGAVTGLVLGSLTWVYTLVLPSFARSGWLPVSFIEQGPLGVTLLKPYAFLGLTSLDHLSHALFWSMLFNIGGYFVVSLVSRQANVERVQASVFVDVFSREVARGATQAWRGTVTVGDLKDVLARFLGHNRVNAAFASYARDRSLDLSEASQADAGTVSFAERLLAGAIGAASARAMVASVVEGEVVGAEDLMKILDETSQVIEYSHQLEQKSKELEALAAKLRAANERLKELDRLKDDFLSAVSHELRTPLTSIRAFGEILYDNPDLPTDQRKEFFRVVVAESERLTRLIDQLLDLAKLEAGRVEWQMTDVDIKATVEAALASTRSLFTENGLDLEVRLPDHLPVVHADRDRLIQVIVNLISNAVKFCRDAGGRVVVSASAADDHVLVSVADNGPGIPPAQQRRVFEKFQQYSDSLTDKPRGTGLGLAISREIVEYFGGRIWVESEPGHGATFSFTVPTGG